MGRSLQQSGPVFKILRGKNRLPSLNLCSYRSFRIIRNVQYIPSLCQAPALYHCVAKLSD